MCTQTISYNTLVLLLLLLRHRKVHILRECTPIVNQVDKDKVDEVDNVDKLDKLNEVERVDKVDEVTMVDLVDKGPSGSPFGGAVWGVVRTRSLGPNRLPNF